MHDIDRTQLETGDGEYESDNEMADEFDRVHSVYRALRVGALHRIIPAADLRPYLIEAVERGMRREEGANGRGMMAASATGPAF